MLAKDAASKDFVAAAFGHCKFIGYVDDAKTLITEARVPEIDDGFIALSDDKAATAFVKAIVQLRFWPRELKVDMDAASFLKA